MSYLDLVEEGEDLLTRAKIEFEEELGLAVEAAAVTSDTGTWIELGEVKQKGGKRVHAWACAGDLPADFRVTSNTFEMEWPPRSGGMQSFPEIDQASFFPLELARAKINPAQGAFLDRLVEALATAVTGDAK
jgi:predicted NUDIX family NTP pyrophosphohydrolase